MAAQRGAERIKILRSDRGGEFLSDEFSAYLKKRGTIRQLTMHDTPEQNGVAERKNRALVEHTRAMLYAAPHMPKATWAEAINHPEQQDDDAKLTIEQDAVRAVYGSEAELVELAALGLHRVRPGD